MSETAKSAGTRRINEASKIASAVARYRKQQYETALRFLANDRNVSILVPDSKLATIVAVQMLAEMFDYRPATVAKHVAIERRKRI